MKLEEVKKDYYDFTGKTSTLVRQLAYAGIALVWTLRTTDAAPGLEPRSLAPAAFLIVLSLGLDVLHYFVSGVIWGTYHRYMERKGTSPKTDFTAPAVFNLPTNVLYILKVLAIIVAYALLLNVLWEWGMKPPS